MPRLSALVPPPLRPLVRRIRSAVRRWEKAPLALRLVPEDLRGTREPATGPLLVSRLETIPCPVRVRNLGRAVWSSHGRHPLAVTFRWLSPRREPLDLPVTSAPLPYPVPPGEAAEVPAVLTAPDSLGHFLIEVDLAQAEGPSLAGQLPRPILVEAQVTGRDADDIDYHTVYATADLDRDYWTVVGPDSREEYDRLGQVKLKQLREIGLTPDSRILDVGCGTGQLAGPLEAFLSDRGCYVGVDIGPEAVAFCRRRYTRPNFRFERNEMTAIPISGSEFDIIAFFSVFTHTYPDETVLLLAEARRLLAPGGVILGDVFTSPMVERSSGNRGAVELNREHFLRLVDLAGLSAEVTASWPWQRYGRREVFRFTHQSRR
jgi:SAM-dependent methyltransferase